MNHAATSREELLAASLKFAAEEGLKSLNIRSIAEECHVSVGCVYRYFPSKADLMSATVEKIWERIFRLTEDGDTPADFRGCVAWVFSCIRSGCAEYPAFFRQHAAAFAPGEKGEGRRVMDQYLARIRQAMLRALERDPAVRQEVFDDAFSREEFVSFLLSDLLSLGIRQASSCDFLLTLVDKLLY